MPARHPIFCDTPELAIECTLAAAEFGLTLEPQVVSAPLTSARRAASDCESIGIALAEAPTAEALAALRDVMQRSELFVVLATLGGGAEATIAREIASDLGIVATHEVRPMLSALALRDAGAKDPWASSIRTLPTPDRARLRDAVDSTPRITGQLLKLDPPLIGWAPMTSMSAHPIGTTESVADALRALRAVNPSRQAIASAVDGVDERAVLDVIFGPARALSDPASKAALIPYGIPVPSEELCSSASRASAEAARLGFPVRIALASPDLRVWQHPDLVVDMVDNAARVRETFRALTALAQTRAPEARILGVTVAATAECHALLKVLIRPLPGGIAETSIGFADAHGLASNDTTTTVLPASVATIERVLSRLRGVALLRSGSAQQRRETVAEISDVLLRASAFATVHAREITSVELRPIALLTGGGIEVREACVSVNDAFEQSYQRASGLS